MRKIVIPIMAAAVVLLVAACTPKQALPEVEQETQRPEKIENDPVQQEEVTATPDDVIATAYGELIFPGMWADRVQYEIEENESDVRIHFEGIVDGVQIPLFTLCYGTVPDNGYEMGALLTDGDMLVPVSTVMYPIVPEESWSEETTNELYALQESVNDLLVQIQSDPNFTA